MNFCTYSPGTRFIVGARLQRDLNCVVAHVSVIFSYGVARLILLAHLQLVTFYLRATGLFL